MPWARSELDFTVVDRARTLGDLLRLLFALMEAVGPKTVADLLNDFDPTANIDPETAGRWLRDERRPSRSHLRLIVRILQSRGLMGAPPARDRLFIRIAAHYAGLAEPVINRIRPLPPIATQLPVTRPTLKPRALPLRELRQHHKLALALQSDLESSDKDLSLFEMQRTKFGFPAVLDRSQVNERWRLIYSQAIAAALAHRPIEPPPTWWQRLIRSVRALVGAK